MTIVLQEVDVIPVGNIAPHTPELGDTTQFITKSNARDALLQNFFNSVTVLSQQSSVVREQLVTILNQQDIANTNVSTQISQVIDDFTNADEVIESGFIEKLLESRNQDQINRYPNNGAFLAASNSATGLHFDTASAFQVSLFSNFFAGFNGADTSQAIEAGRFYYNSTSYGGSEPSITGVALDFANKMGCANWPNNGARYVPGFSVAEFQASSGDAGGNWNNNYTFMTMANMVRMGANGRASISFYYQPVSSASYLQGYGGSNPQRQVLLDGVVVPGGDPVTLTAGTVYYISAWVSDSDRATNSYPLTLYGAVNAYHRIACPRIASGAFALAPHSWPVRSSQHI